MLKQLLTAMVLVCLCAQAQGDGAPGNVPWESAPAEGWTEAYPVGNGRLGGMVFGGIADERIQLNEISLWSGGPQDADNPDARAALPEIRRLINEGKYSEAQRVSEKRLVCKGPGSGQGNGADVPFGCYQTLGDLWLSFPGLAEATGYQRVLDLEHAAAISRFEAGGVNYSRRVFASAPDKVLVVVLEADMPGKISVRAELDRHPGNASTPWKNNSRRVRHSEPVREALATGTAIGPSELLMTGRAGKEMGVRYAARLRVLATNGEMTSDQTGIAVRGADRVVLLLSAATDFKAGDPAAATAEVLANAGERALSELQARHEADFAALWGACQLELGAAPALATNARRARAAQGEKDPALDALYFAFGRYLLISSSRPGGLPANLQGLWCDHLQSPWNCDYHTNINVQMNYWPAETTGLAACHEPLIDFIGTLVEPGQRTARTHYDADGWVVHTITNIWGFTSPGEHPSWGSYPCASAWLCAHLWEHYTFNPDKAYLERVYPILKSASEFFVDFLVPDRSGKWLVTSPSNSPENSFKTADGQQAAICAGPTMDRELLHELFSNTAKAAEVLGVDEGLRGQWIVTRDRLAPLQVGRHGQLMEWLEDFDEPEPGHRHMSHLYALHPGSQITPAGTPELAQAARVTLDRRLAGGGGHTGWSRAWIINFYARLADGERAHEHLSALLAKSTLPNLFDNHPPFQIDGNFGATAGIAEMLVQSHTGEIQLLPALPGAWPEGEVRGLRARGGVTLSRLAWKDGALRSVTMISPRGGTHTIRLGGRSATVHLAPNAETTLDGALQVE